MDDRKSLQAMLKAFETEQKDLLLQAEQRLEVIIISLFKRVLGSLNFFFAYSCCEYK